MSINILDGWVGLIYVTAYNLDEIEEGDIYVHITTDEYNAVVDTVPPDNTNIYDLNNIF